MLNLKISISKKINFGITIIFFLILIIIFLNLRLNYSEPSQRIILLSFDVEPVDGDTTVLELIKILKEENVEATFFVTGEYAKLYPKVVKKIVESDNELACHTYDHPKLPQLTEFQKYEEINECKKILEKISGVQIIGFRAPYNLLDKESVDLLNYLGFEYDASILQGWELLYPNLDTTQKTNPSYDKSQITELSVSGVLLIPLEDVIWMYYTKGLGTKPYFYILKNKKSAYSSYLFHPHWIIREKETFRETIIHLKKQSTIFISHSRITKNHGG